MKTLIKQTMLIAGALTMVGCSNQSSELDIGFDYGTVLTMSKALPILSDVCSKDSIEQANEGNKSVSLQAGYVENFNGSGTSYSVVDGFRKGAAQMWDASMMAMFPPSVKADHKSIIAATCLTAKRALKRASDGISLTDDISGSTQAIKVTEGTKPNGTLAQGKVNSGACIVSVEFKNSSNGSTGSLHMCENGTVITGKTSGVPASQSAVVIQDS